MNLIELQYIKESLAMYNGRYVEELPYTSFDELAVEANKINGLYTLTETYFGGIVYQIENAFFEERRLATSYCYFLVADCINIKNGVKSKSVSIDANMLFRTKAEVIEMVRLLGLRKIKLELQDITSHIEYCKQRLSTVKTLMEKLPQ